MIDKQQLDHVELNTAISTIARYIADNAAIDYTFRLEFIRLNGQYLDMEVSATLEDPEGEDVHVDSEGSWIASACYVSRELEGKP